MSEPSANPARPRAVRPRMEAYGVPDDTDGMLDWEWAEQRLVSCRNYWVVTATSDGRPHSMPVWGVWIPGEARFVFLCASTARKAANLRANPRMVVTTDDSVEVVSVEGTAEEVAADTVGGVLAGYAAKYEPDPGKAEELERFLLENACFRFTPERAFGVIERPEEFGRRATKWLW